MTHAVLLTELKRRFQLQHQDKGSGQGQDKGSGKDRGSNQSQDKNKGSDKEKEEDRNRHVAVRAQSNLPVKSDRAQSDLPVKSDRAQSNLPVINFLRPVTVHANWMVGSDDKVGMNICLFI